MMFHNVKPSVINVNSHRIQRKFTSNMTTIHSMYKSELAELAGVSPRTFTRWLRVHRQELAQVGIPPRAKLLSPKAVRMVCELFCIDL